MNYPSRICLICNKEFIPIKAGNVCCSDKCKNIRRSIQKRKLAYEYYSCSNIQWLNSELEKAKTEIKILKLYITKLEDKLMSDTELSEGYNWGLKLGRKCHDCGKPTNNYRCKECMKKFRKKYDISKNEIDED